MATELITDAELLALGLAEDAMGIEVSSTVRDAHRAAAASMVQSRLKKRHALPWSSWSDDVKIACASIAAYTIISYRGYNPKSGADTAIKDRYLEMVAWMDLVVLGDAEVEDIEDATSAIDEAGPLIASDDPSGWEYPLTS